ncbi:MAG: lamin tail domain-containing protein [Flavisolibacter sp.]
MKTNLTNSSIRGLFLFWLLITVHASSGQGRVVINEIMPWSGCNTTSEFVELLNFGPGPMNIGCYIVTNGQYAITIPPNTIINTGQYYVLSGQDILAKGCGNMDSAVHANLNWTTCNCTDKPIPVTGDGFMQNGGSANEKIVLLDPNLNVVDAVSRNATPSASAYLTSASLNGGCSSRSFDLDSMHISYESINSSTGIDNSFARKVDGDCGWVKTTVISAGAPNKTGSTSSATYDFSTLSASECSGTTGSISIKVTASDVNSLFPMNYTLAFDKDSNNLFNGLDQYQYGVDSTAPNIDISKLIYGRYRITVGSSMGCNLKSYDFFIFNCYGVPLPLKILDFRYEGVQGGQMVFACRLAEPASAGTIVLEGSLGVTYRSVASISAPFNDKELTFRIPGSAYQYFRLRLVDKTGAVSYTQVLHPDPPDPGSILYWPNPVNRTLSVRLPASVTGNISYLITNGTGVVVRRGEGIPSTTILTVGMDDLGSGIYYMQLMGPSFPKPLSFKFLK